MTAIVVRFAPGEVTYPEAVYPESAPLERVLFRTPQVREILAESGVYGLSLVCPGWRHLEAPQYDIDGEEIPIEQMVDFADVYRLEWDRSVAPDRIRERLQRRGEVVYVELMSPLGLDYPQPGDEHYPIQWGLENTGQEYPEPCVPCSSDVDINAPEAWDYQDSCSVLIGVIDSGIDYDHEDLVDAVHTSLHFGPDDGEEEESCTWPHGTAVAGIIGATGGADSVGIVGVASPRGGRFLVSMRATADGAWGVTADLVADALDWATSPSVFPAIPIANGSFSGGPVQDQLPFWYATLRDAYRNAYLKGLTLPVSAGNDVTYPTDPRWPGAFEDFTIACGSVRCDGSFSPGYVVGLWKDVVAPGGKVGDPSSFAHIVTCYGETATDDGYWGVDGRQYFGGSSAATAFVSGVAGLVKSAWPVWSGTTATNDDIAALLRISARNLGDEGPDIEFGHGLVRADAALELFLPPHEVHKDAIEPDTILYLGGFTDLFRNIPCISLHRETLEWFWVGVYEVRGYAPFSDSALAVWPRGRQSVGWRDFRDEEDRTDFGIDGQALGNWAEVAPGTVTADGCSLRAYTYHFHRNGNPVGWYPIDGATGLPVCPAGTSTSLAYTYITAGDQNKTAGHPPAMRRIKGGPNSARGPYRLTWSLESRAPAEAAVFDVAGRQVRLLHSGMAGPGELVLVWDGSDTAGHRVPRGVYFLRMRSGTSMHTVQLVR